MKLAVLVAVADKWDGPLTSAFAEVSSCHVVRRCADLPDLLAAAATGLAEAAVISSDLRGLDRSALGRLGEHGIRVLGVYPPGGEDGERFLRQLGLTTVLPADASSELIDDAMHALSPLAPPRAVSGEFGGESGGESAAAPGSSADPGSGHGRRAGDDLDRAGVGDGQGLAVSGLTDRGLMGDRLTNDLTIGDLPIGDLPIGDLTIDDLTIDDAASAGRPHQLVAVWGPTGAPGRTTVAVNLAAELALLGIDVLLVDADTYGASIAQTLSLLDEAPGVAAATRAADQGTLDLPALAKLAPEVSPGLRVLTGLPRAERWPELREHAFAQVLTLSRQLASVTVVDCGFSLEDDEELSYDTRAPRRNAVTLAALRVGDVVLAVGSAEPVGLQRLVRGLQEIAGVVDVTPRVVVNKLRTAAVGGDAERRVREALARFAGVSDAWFVPDDRPGLDAAMLAGRALCEVAATSRARQSLAALAADLVGIEQPAHRRHRWSARPDGSGRPGGIGRPVGSGRRGGSGRPG